MRRYSELPCKCGWHHQLDAFAHGELVETLGDKYAWIGRLLVPAGTVGEVQSWSQYGSDVYVRVEFPDLRDEWGFRIRENYRPCELEHLMCPHCVAAAIGGVVVAVPALNYLRLKLRKKS